MPLSDPTYKSWRAMINRCYRPNCNGFENYGGRGIKVCAQWRASWRNFLSDMGPRPRGYQIGRIDNDGDYTPFNCEWQTPKQNGRNRRTTLWCVCNGRLVSAAEAREMLGVNKHSLEAYLWKRKPNLVDVTGLKFVPRKKLNASQVREIRSSTEPEIKTAKRYGVSRALVRHIKARRAWKSLP